MNRIAILHAPRDLRYEVQAVPPVGPRDVHVRTRLGAISAGTELAWYLGTDPQLDPQFKPGRFSHAGFPRRLEYEQVAEVVGLGNEVEQMAIGQRVVAHYGHGEEAVVPAAQVISIPDEISDEEAVSASLGAMAVHAVHRAQLRLGDDVLIAGLGFVGLLTLVAARLAGAHRVVVCDRYAKRLALAAEFGADLMLNPCDVDVAAAIRSAFGPESIDVAFECSASYDALADTMAVLKRNGRVCVVSQLRGNYPSHPVFGMDFHLGELEMISSDGRGDRAKHCRWFFGAIRRGAINDVGRLISHRVPFERLGDGYRLIDEQPEEVVKVAVTYA